MWGGRGGHLLADYMSVMGVLDQGWECWLKLAMLGQTNTGVLRAIAFQYSDTLGVFFSFCQTHEAHRHTNHKHICLTFVIAMKLCPWLQLFIYSFMLCPALQKNHNFLFRMIQNQSLRLWKVFPKVTANHCFLSSAVKPQVFDCVAIKKVLLFGISVFTF